MRLLIPTGELRPGAIPARALRPWRSSLQNVGNVHGPSVPGVHRRWQIRELKAPVLHFRREPSGADLARLGTVHANRRRVPAWTADAGPRRDVQLAADLMEAVSRNGKSLRSGPATGMGCTPIRRRAPSATMHRICGAQPPSDRLHSLVQVVTSAQTITPGIFNHRR